MKQSKVSKEKFKFLEHTADVKLRAYGETLEGAFKSAAMALKETILKKSYSKKIKIKPKISKKIKVRGKDEENLLLNFLEEFLFLLDAKNFIFSKVKNIKIRQGDGKSRKRKKYVLNAEVMGDKASLYEFTNDVKAVTYNEMFVKKEKNKKGKNKYICQVVLDV